MKPTDFYALLVHLCINNNFDIHKTNEPDRSYFHIPRHITRREAYLYSSDFEVSRDK